MSSSQLPPGVPIQNLPAAKPPQGVRPNFVDPPSYQHALIILEGIFVPLMLLFVFMRIFVRTRISKTWGWDDSTCIIAACGSLVHMIDYTQMFGVGFGRHLWDIRAITLLDEGNSQLLSANGVVYPFTILFVKLSILLLYLRIFSVDRAFRIIIFAGIIFLSLYYVAMIGVAIGSIKECNGPSQVSKQFCQNYGAQVVVLNATVNVVTDIFVLLLPVSRVLKLQLGARLFGYKDETLNTHSKTQSSSKGERLKVVQQKASAESNGWYGDEARLKGDSFLELRDGDDFRGNSAVKVGNRSDTDMSAEHEFSMDEQPGILRTTEYQIESRSRV
ncbi:hypothetical protein ACLMJK_003431 [Lecanora helva]